MWGANTGFDFAQLPPGDGRPIWPPPQPYVPVPPQPGQPCRQGTDQDFPGGAVDLRAYAGVTFWAMASDAGVRVLRVQINDVNTDPRGGICNAADLADEADCYNAFGVEVTLTSAPKRYRIAFSDLMQGGSWGYRVAAGVPDWQRVYSMSFSLGERVHHQPERDVRGRQRAAAVVRRLDRRHLLRKQVAAAPRASRYASCTLLTRSPRGDCADLGSRHERTQGDSK